MVFSMSMVSSSESSFGSCSRSFGCCFRPSFGFCLGPRNTSSIPPSKVQVFALVRNIASRWDRVSAKSISIKFMARNTESGVWHISGPTDQSWTLREPAMAMVGEIRNGEWGMAIPFFVMWIFFLAPSRNCPWTGSTNCHEQMLVWISKDLSLCSKARATYLNEHLIL